MFRKVYYTGFIAYILLFVFAVFFYKERMFFSDASLYLFKIVKEGNFAFFHRRFIAAFTEIFPLLTIKLHLPLSDVCKSYSAGFIVFYAATYFICGVVLRNYKMALVILMTNILLVTDSFYWCLSELAAAMSLMLAFFAFLMKYKDRRMITILCTLIFLPILVFAHPFLIIPFSFLIIYFYWRSKTEIAKRILILVSVAYFFILIVKFIFFKDPYDKGSLGGLRNFIRLFPDYFSLYSNKLFLLDSVRKYFWLPILSTGIMVHYIRTKQWKFLALFIFYVVAIVGFVNVCFPDEKTPMFYRENLYLTLSVVIGVVMFYDLLPHTRLRRFSFLIVVLIIISGIGRIYFYKSPYTNRLAWLRKYLEMHKNEKIIESETPEQHKILMLSWGTPYEFWLLSTIENDKTACLMIADKPLPYAIPEDTKQMWLAKWELYNYRDLERRYFIFEDTNTGYHIIK